LGYYAGVVVESQEEIWSKEKSDPERISSSTNNAFLLILSVEKRIGFFSRIATGLYGLVCEIHFMRGDDIFSGLNSV
jgi:hypothetical protein